MTISFILNDEAVNDQTTGLQTGDNLDDAFTDTDVPYSSLPASFRTYLELTLGLNSAFPTSIGVATKTNSVTVNATAGSQLVGTTFTDINGGTLNGDDSGLNTLGGKDILLFADGNNTVIGRYDSDGNGIVNNLDAIAFVVFKQDVINAGATSDQVTFNIVTYVPIFHSGNPNPDDAVDLGNTLKLAASETLNFGFAGAPSGSNLFMTFGDPNSTQIVVIGKDPLDQSQGGNITTKDVLNISQAGSTTSFGVNGNQINPTEGAYITYVSGTNTNFLVPNLDQNEADVEANIDFQNVVSATGASFTVNQTNPGIGPVTVKISAFTTAAEPGVNFVNGLTNDTHVAITSFSLTNVIVKTGNTQYTPVASIDANGDLIITGLSSGDTVQWTTSGTHNRVLIENVSNADGDPSNDNNTFDIGGFGIVTSNSASEFVGQQIVIEDDGPTAGIVQGAPTVAHDETAGIQADADDTTAPAVVALFAGVSNVSSDLSPTGYAQDPGAVVSSTGSSFGTDQAGGTTAFSLAVSAAGVDSGLDTTAGTSIFLFKEGNLVVGRIGGAGGAAAFAVAINSTTGVVSVAQYASIHHPTPGASHDESVNITDSALLAVVTVTDGDGDTATSSTGIGDAVQFQDDGPTAGIVQGAPTVAHDETAGIQADADDTTAPAVVALFAGVSNVSSDLSPTGYAQDPGAVVSSTGSSFGADQEGGTTAFSLAVSAAGVDSGLDTTAGTSIFLFKEGDLVVGRIGGAAGAAAFAVAINSTTGVVSVAQYASIHHPTPGASHDESVNITDSALLAVVTVTDGDGDTATSSTGIGDAVQFQDDGPTAGIVQGAPTVAHDETAGNQADADDTTAPAVVALFAGVSNVSSNLSPTGYAQDPGAVVSSTGSSFGADQEGGTTAFSLAVSAAGVDSGLDTTAGTSIFLFKEGDLVVGRIGGAAGAAAFAVAINSTTGVVSVAQYASILHPTPGASHDESVNITDSALLAVVTVTDGDGDTATSSTGIGDAVQFQDDGPTITKQFDGDQDNLAGIPLIGTHEILTNVNPSSATGDFGYNIGSDQFAVYDATHSDFVDQTGLAGIQLSLDGYLTGLVPNTQTPFISSFATLQSESATSASFNWQISYDSDPNTAGDQTATAGGTLVFDKSADTYTITLNDAVEGFTKDILHTSELISKEPTSNVGHPNIVVEKLFDATTTPETTDRDFFVQFTANSTTNSIQFGLNTTGDSDASTPADTAWNPGDLVTNNHEDWVSATQSTNGVAGDTIQKGELLTLRFFDHSPGIATEDITPNQTANDMAIKFDGIGNSEDLMVILDLVSADGTQHTSKAVYISNADIFKTGQVPTAYAADFPLDNNDGLVIIERNDYNGAGENWVIEGAQIMQSGNGITGPDSDPILAGLQETPTAIDLNRTTGSAGSSSQTTLVNWDPTDNDVLKIVDLGFTSTQTTTPDAHLDFGVQLHDADGDTTTIQHILVDVV